MNRSRKTLYRLLTSCRFASEGFFEPPHWCANYLFFQTLNFIKKESKNNIFLGFKRDQQRYLILQHSFLVI